MPCERDDLLPTTSSSARFGDQEIDDHKSRSSFGAHRLRIVAAVVASSIFGIAIVTQISNSNPSQRPKLGGTLAMDDLGQGLIADLGSFSTVNAANSVLPVFFHTEKSGGTSLTSHALQLLAQDRSEVLEILNRVRHEDVMLDGDLRRVPGGLCPGSAMFLTTVWKAGSVWEPGARRALEDSSRERWLHCSLLTSHTGRELLKRELEIEQELGFSRPKILMGMFRDPVEYEQAAWRSELFMYHDLRAELGWGKLAQTPLGSALAPSELSDFGPNSTFAKIMLNEHCAKGLDVNFQTKKVLEEVWGEISRNRAAALEEAKKRVRALAWIGLTHKFDQSACMLAYTLRKKPLATSNSNYDRAKLLPQTLAANHPHSGSADEGAVGSALKDAIYKCNDMDTEVFHLAQQEFDARVQKVKKELKSLVDAKKDLSSIEITGPQWLRPQEYLDCLNKVA